MSAVWLPTKATDGETVCPSATTATGARSGAVISRPDPSDRRTTRTESHSARSDWRLPASTHTVAADAAPGVISRSSHARTAGERGVPSSVPPPARTTIGLPAATASSLDAPNPGRVLAGITSQSAYAIRRAAASKERSAIPSGSTSAISSDGLPPLSLTISIASANCRTSSGASGPEGSTTTPATPWRSTRSAATMSFSCRSTSDSRSRPEPGTGPISSRR